MGAKLTQKTFLERIQKVHGDLYTTDLAVYERADKRVTMVCKIHGEFHIPPNKLFAGFGCQLCSKERVKVSLSGDTETFCKSAKKIHGDKYDYSRVVYVSNTKKVAIICPVHGEFLQAPSCHVRKLRPTGCPTCASELKKGNGSEVKLDNLKAALKQIKVDNPDVTFSAGSSISVHGSIKVVCPVHGDYTRKIYKALKEVKLECPMCEAVKSFESRASELHKGKYTYHGDYKSLRGRVRITCPIHGDFYQKAEGHLTLGFGCKKCGHVEQGLGKSRGSGLRFIEKSAAIHGDTYDYSKTVYSSCFEKVIIICKTHGEFLQSPDAHLAGKGCNKCAHHVSKAETEIGDFIESQGFKVIRNSRDVISPKEIDLYIPELSLAIEYNGVHWHSEEFSRGSESLIEKTNECAKQGIRLIHVNSDESMEVVKKTIKSMLSRGESVFARKCEVKKVGNVDDFLELNHVQGKIGLRAHNYALFYEGVMVAVMVFGRPTSQRGKSNKCLWELRRFASSVRVVGGASKLLKAFLRCSGVEVGEIISFSDNRWFTGNMYEKLGFKQVKELKPDYKYTKNGRTFPKNHFTRAKMKGIGGDFIYDPKKTEKENCEANRLYRIWDCGKKKWSLIV